MVKRFGLCVWPGGGGGGGAVGMVFSERMVWFVCGRGEDSLVCCLK